MRVSDPVSLWRPSPDSQWPPTAPVLSGEYADPDVGLDWSPSESPDSGVAGYRVYRVTALAEPVQIADLEVDRNYIGTIISQPLAYTDVDPSAGSYEYFVQAYDLRGFASAMSNAVLLTVT